MPIEYRGKIQGPTGIEGVLGVQQKNNFNFKSGPQNFKSGPQLVEKLEPSVRLKETIVPKLKNPSQVPSIDYGTGTGTGTGSGSGNQEGGAVETGSKEPAETQVELGGNGMYLNENGDFVSAKDYYLNGDLKEQAELTRQKYANEAKKASLESARYLQQNAVQANENYTRNQYQAAQQTDKSGFSGGYVLDTQRQLQFLQSSIQSDIYSQQELQKLGYQTNLDAALISAELENTNMAIEQYKFAQQQALDEADVTGYYMEPAVRQMQTQFAAAQAILDNKESSKADINRAQKIQNQVRDYFQKYCNVTIVIGDQESGYAAKNVTAVDKWGETEEGESSQYAKEDSHILTWRGFMTKAQRDAEIQAKVQADSLALEQAKQELEKQAQEWTQDSSLQEAKNAHDGTAVPVFKNGRQVGWDFDTVPPVSGEDIDLYIQYYKDNPSEFGKVIQGQIDKILTESGYNKSHVADEIKKYLNNHGNAKDITELLKIYAPEGETELTFADGEIKFKKVGNEWTVEIGGNNSTNGGNENNNGNNGGNEDNNGNNGGNENNGGNNSGNQNSNTGTHYNNKYAAGTKVNDQWYGILASEGVDRSKAEAAATKYYNEWHNEIDARGTSLFYDDDLDKSRQYFFGDTNATTKKGGQHGNQKITETTITTPTGKKLKKINTSKYGEQSGIDRANKILTALGYELKQGDDGKYGVYDKGKKVSNSICVQLDDGTWIFSTNDGGWYNTNGWDQFYDK